MAKPFRFFLGGQDLEMVEIRRLLERHGPDRIEDKRLAWGAKLSDYRAELLASLGRGETPVLVELADDLPPELFDRGRTVVVDHHGPMAGHDRPTAVEQVFALLELPKEAWTRRLALVAANDRAHVAGLRAMGATRDEIAAIRAEDRAAQGVTAEDEAEARRAMAARRSEGRLTVVCTTSRTSSAIADLMLRDLGGPGYDRLLVVMPEKVAVFGDGAAVHRLAAAHPSSWWGGDLPEAGFWGAARPPDAPDWLRDVIELIR